LTPGPGKSENESNVVRGLRGTLRRGEVEVERESVLIDGTRADDLNK